MKKAILVDIHGTLVDAENKPIQCMIDLVNAYKTGKKCLVILITAGLGYNMKSNMGTLKSQLARIGINYDKLCFAAPAYFIKNVDDYSDEQIKHEIYTEEIRGKYEIIFVLDNNKKCCKMWHEVGIDCLRYKSK